MKRVEIKKVLQLSVLAAGFFVASYTLTGGPASAGLASSPQAAPARAEKAKAAAAPKKSAALKAAAAKPQRPVKKQPLPRIVAVDKRIAKRTDQLRPNVKKRLAHAADKLPEGVTLMVTSAYRTRGEQAALQSTFGVKARPGTSTHELGRGVDLNVLVDGERIPPRKQHRVIGEAMSDAGFRHLGPSDPVHYSVPEWELDPEPEVAPSLHVPSLDEAREEQAAAAPEEPVLDEQTAAF